MSRPYYYLTADGSFLTIVVYSIEHTLSRHYKKREIIHIIFAGDWKTIKLEVRD